MNNSPRDRSRYHDTLPLPPGGLLAWLGATGYYERSLAELERELAAPVRRCKQRRCKRALSPRNQSGYCIKHVKVRKD